MSLRLLPAAILVLLPALARAEAPNPSFYLVNRSPQAINEVYASPVSARAWGADRLGDATIDSGGNAPIRLRATGNCLFDLRVVYDNGRSEERRGVNTCTVDNISFGQASTARSAARGDQTLDPSFRVVNRGRRELREVYARPAGTNEWGPDLLGDDTVPPGEWSNIDLPTGRCQWDLRMVFTNDRPQERRGLNLCDVTELRVP